MHRALKLLIKFDLAAAVVVSTGFAVVQLPAAANAVNGFLRNHPRIDAVVRPEVTGFRTGLIQGEQVGKAVVHRLLGGGPGSGP